MQPIGTCYCSSLEKYQAARQPELMKDARGVIRLDSGKLYEQALEDLEGIDRIWVIFLFDQVQHWKPKVQPPRGKKKRGVFATRSPHRPNPIGLSCVELLRIQGLDLHIGSHDMLNGTPVLDIKPYLPYADAYPDSSAGWIDELQNERFTLHWSALALDQIEWIKERSDLDIRQYVSYRLETAPYPHPSHRIESLGGHRYVLGFKSWRIAYEISERSKEVNVSHLYSGYRTFLGEDVYGDFELHRKFQEHFLTD